MQEAYRLTAQDVVLQKTPFSFDVSVWEFFWPLLVGSTLVIARPGGHMDPEYLSQIIFREGVTVLHFVPSMLEVFLQQPLGGKVGSVRYVFCSGEALGYDLQQRFFAQMACELHNLYGPTEASVDVTAWRCDPGLHAGTVPIGFPIANTRVYILDVAGGLLPPGLIGEIYLAGTGLARGYLNKPELTAARFVERELAPQRHERLYRTLDLGRYRDDGSIEFLGRADSQIKLRGFRIELGEIESVLSRHPAVREVVVVVHQARAGDRRLVAYLVAAQAQEDLARSLRAHAQRYLPEYMVPAAFVALAQMPLSANGKVERRALPAPDWRLQAADGPASAAPGTALKQLLSELFAEVLGLPAVGCNDDFFRLGGHSLLATRVIARIGQILPMPVPLSLLFEATTVDSLAVRLEELWKSQNADLDLSQVLTAVLSMSDSEVEAQLLQLENS
jgi:acyl-coenzyme A synthetase/AMP-(fatty) acid ligase